MEIIKARKQDNSIVMTIPSCFGVKEEDQFFIIKKDNEAITMIPKSENPFETAKDGEFYTPGLNI